MNSGVSLHAKTAFFNDVTIGSSLRSVVKVLMGHFTTFQSRGLSGWFVPKIIKSCLNLSKLRPKYYWSLVSGHGVLNPTDSATVCSTCNNLQRSLHSRSLHSLTQGHRQYHHLLDRLYFLSEIGKLVYSHFRVNSRNDLVAIRWSYFKPSLPVTWSMTNGL